MDDRTGQLYASREEALAAKVPPEHIVELVGARRSIDRISSAVRHAAKHEATRRRRAGQAKSKARRRLRALLREKEGSDER